MVRYWLLPLVALAGTGAASPDFDIVIRHGRVLDGAGNPWVLADVALKDGRIVRIGTVTGKGATEIDATGRYVAPGFIDMMDQSGAVLLKNGAAENKLRMGVTTLIAGEGGTPVAANEIAAYFAQLERQGIAVNFGTSYSAAQARTKVMGDAAGVPTEDQLRGMEAEVTTAMRAGVFGITSALIYPPNSFQSTADLTRLAHIAGTCGGFYSTHMRDESSKLLDGISEAIAIGERSGAKVEIYHLKAAYAPQWGKLMPQAVAMIEAARARGVDVAADMYPYRAGGTGLDVTVPTHVFADGRAAALRRLADPAVRIALKKELLAGPQPDWSNLVDAAGGWDNVVLANAYDPAYTRFEGKSFGEIARTLDKDAPDVAWDILIAAQPKRATALYFLMSEGDIELAIRQPWVSIGTDSAASAGTGNADPAGRAHPRAFGTFPRVIAEYALKRHVLTLEDAVRKMTSWPAQRMGLTDRGALREGLRADITIFDARTIRDVADWTNPTENPVGIGDVIVNGRVALSGGIPTGSRSGAVLRHTCTL